MKTVEKLAWASSGTLALTVIAIVASCVVSPWLLAPSAVFVLATMKLAEMEVTAAQREKHLSADPSAAYLPDAEREVDAMGLNGPALRASDDNGSTKALDAIARKQRAIENALTAPPRPTGYVMAGRVFPAPEDPEWRGLGGNCWSHRKAAVFVGEPYVSVDGVPVVVGARAAKYANAIQAAKKWDEKREKEKAIARALATLPLAPKDGDA